MEKTRRLPTFAIIGGYKGVSASFTIVFNLLFASILIIFSLPFLLVVAIIVKLQDGGPILYSGLRLGMHKGQFKMYKFRTMVTDADVIIKKDILKSHPTLVTPFGKFLRDTRLDELPQLFNIIKGDMSFVGPRPLPPVLYDSQCKTIKGYDKRFLVRPGLIGYSQLFTPHSAPKRLRAAIDNKYVDIYQSLLLDIFFILFTIVIVLKVIVFKSAKYGWRLVNSLIFHKYKEKRVKERLQQVSAKVYCGTREASQEALLVDINDEAFLMYTRQKINLTESVFTLEKDVFKRRLKRYVKKIAICKGNIYKEYKLQNNHFEYAYVIQYIPKSSINQYKIHQYFLFESMA